MKTCPVCHAKAFDDAEICYGCMYRYGDDPDRVEDTDVSEGAPVEFRITFTPVREPSGVFTWKCAVEM